MRIDVTQEDIDKGQCARKRLCAVALAAQRATGDPLASVGCEVLYVNTSNGPRHVRLPMRVQEWIEAFDDGAPVEPFSFRVNL